MIACQNASSLPRRTRGVPRKASGWFQLLVFGAGIRLNRRLREAAEAALGGAASPQERAEQALRFVLEIARLLGPEVRARAQAHLESLGEEEQRGILENAPEPPEAVGESLGRLISLVIRGGG